MLISFICTGNICRSPAAALIARSYFAQAGIDNVTITSAGTSQYHIGDGAHPHSRAVLASRGYNTEHSARTLGEQELAADLVVVATSEHKSLVEDFGVPPERVKLLRSFDDSAPTAELADPYYKDYSAYEEMVTQIESAMPGLVKWAVDHGAHIST